jgi:hypothetical protein
MSRTPGALCAQGRDSERGAMNAVNGVPERSRTSDLALRRRLLYPSELPGQVGKALQGYC